MHFPHTCHSDQPPQISPSHPPGACRKHTFNHTKAAFECFRTLARRFEVEINSLLEEGKADLAQALLAQAFHPEPTDRAGESLQIGQTGREAAAEAARRFSFSWMSEVRGRGGRQLTFVWYERPWLSSWLRKKPGFRNGRDGKDHASAWMARM